MPVPDRVPVTVRPTSEDGASRGSDSHRRERDRAADRFNWRNSPPHSAHAEARIAAPSWVINPKLRTEGCCVRRHAAAPVALEGGDCTMVAVDLKTLVGRLTDTCRRQLEAAAGLTLSRSHYNVEIE